MALVDIDGYDGDTGGSVLANWPDGGPLVAVLTPSRTPTLALAWPRGLQPPVPLGTSTLGRVREARRVYLSHWQWGVGGTAARFSAFLFVSRTISCWLHHPPSRAGGRGGLLSRFGTLLRVAGRIDSPVVGGSHDGHAAPRRVAPAAATAPPPPIASVFPPPPLASVFLPPPLASVFPPPPLASVLPTPVSGALPQQRSPPPLASLPWYGSGDGPPPRGGGGRSARPRGAAIPRHVAAGDNGSGGGGGGGGSPRRRWAGTMRHGERPKRPSAMPRGREEAQGMQDGRNEEKTQAIPQTQGCLPPCEEKRRVPRDETHIRLRPPHRLTHAYRSPTPPTHTTPNPPHQ